MFISISIPSYRKVEDDQDKSYTVYVIEVSCRGKFHTVEKRYSEFDSLHKKVKNRMQTPEFPPKKVMKWNHKVLEQRRAALEVYLQGVLNNKDVPRSLLNFLQVHSADSDSIDTLENTENLGLSHQPVMAFSENVYLADQKDGPADIVLGGVLQGFYGMNHDVG